MDQVLRLVQPADTVWSIGAHCADYAYGDYPSVHEAFELPMYRHIRKVHYTASEILWTVSVLGMTPGAFLARLEATCSTLEDVVRLSWPVVLKIKDILRVAPKNSIVYRELVVVVHMYNMAKILTEYGAICDRIYEFGVYPTSRPKYNWQRKPSSLFDDVQTRWAGRLQPETPQHLRHTEELLALLGELEAHT